MFGRIVELFRFSVCIMAESELYFKVIFLKDILIFAERNSDAGDD